MLELYHAGLTTCSKKVRLCLREKGLPYRSRFVALAKFEQHSEQYLRLNPDGLVPTLVADGEPIVESMLINEYIDERFPSPPLRPAEPERRARMRLYTKLADNYGLPSVQYLTEAYTILGRLATTHSVLGADGQIDQARLRALIDAIPVKATRMRWERLAKEGLDQSEVDKARSAAERILMKVEAGLEDGPWLMGEQYTLADIDVLPFIDRYEQYHPMLLNESTTPKTVAWLQRMRQRPAVIATYQPSDEAPAIQLHYRPESIRALPQGQGQTQEVAART